MAADLAGEGELGDVVAEALTTVVWTIIGDERLCVSGMLF